MEQEASNILTPSGEPDRIKIQYIVMEDILFRAPLWGIFIAIVFGGLAYLMIWFILNVMEPYMKENLNNGKTGQIEMRGNIYHDHFSTYPIWIEGDEVIYV